MPQARTCGPIRVDEPDMLKPVISGCKSAQHMRSPKTLRGRKSGRRERERERERERGGGGGGGWRWKRAICYYATGAYVSADSCRSSSCCAPSGEAAQHEYHSRPTSGVARLFCSVTPTEHALEYNLRAGTKHSPMPTGGSPTSRCSQVLRRALRYYAADAYVRADSATGAYVRADEPDMLKPVISGCKSDQLRA